MNLEVLLINVKDKIIVIEILNININHYNKLNYIYLDSQNINL